MSNYLDMLQAVIARMANNQFTCCAWSVALGTAVIGYAVAKDGKPAMAILALLPTLSFWIQDAYYLGLERAFRKKFTDAAAAGATSGLFDFAVSPKTGEYIAAFFRPRCCSGALTRRSVGARRLGASMTTADLLLQYEVAPDQFRCTEYNGVPAGRKG
jgi:hypothetical protein